MCSYCENAEQHITSPCSDAVLFPSAQADNSWDEGGSATMAPACQLLLAQLWGTIRVPSPALEAFDRRHLVTGVAGTLSAVKQPWQHILKFYGVKEKCALCFFRIKMYAIDLSAAISWFISHTVLPVVQLLQITHRDRSQTQDFNSSFHKSGCFQKNEGYRMEIGN